MLVVELFGLTSPFRNIFLSSVMRKSIINHLAVAWADGLGCSIATRESPILNFEGTDFTTGDMGIVGRDATRKNRNTGVWVYDLSLSAGSRTKIVSEGGFPDWSN